MSKKDKTIVAAINACEVYTGIAAAFKSAASKKH